MSNNEIQEFLVETIINKPMQAYSECVKRLSRNPNDNEARSRIGEIEGFFLSEPFTALTHAKGSQVIVEIHAMLEKQGVHISALLSGREQKDVQ